MQAVGFVHGAPFYFRARWETWTFTISLTDHIDPSAIGPPDEKAGFFRADDYLGYRIWGYYGQKYDASYMRYDDVERIIRECVRRYLEE